METTIFLWFSYDFIVATGPTTCMVPYFIPSRTWNPLVKIHHFGVGSRFTEVLGPSVHRSAIHRPARPAAVGDLGFPMGIPWWFQVISMGISWGFKIDENGDFRDLVGSNEKDADWEFYRGFSWKFMRLTFITRVVWYSDQLKDFFLALDEPLPSDKMGGHRSHRWWLQVDQVLWKTGNIFVSQPLKIHHS